MSERMKETLILTLGIFTIICGSLCAVAMGMGGVVLLSKGYWVPGVILFALAVFIVSYGIAVWLKA